MRRGKVRGWGTPVHLANDRIKARLSPGEAFFYSEENARIAHRLYRERGLDTIVHYEDSDGSYRTVEDDDE